MTGTIPQVAHGPGIRGRHRRGRGDGILPPRTPQLNQIENVWRDLKKRLAGRYFKSTEELKAAMTAILEKEMGNRLVGYLVN